MYNILAQILKDRDFSVWCQVQNCAVFFVFDDENGSKIVNEESEKTFKVSNENALRVYFLPIDNALITGKDSFPVFQEDGQNSNPRCDFALFTENALCLVELKMNMTTDSELSKSSKAEEALKQLWNTLDFILSEAQKKGLNIPSQAVFPIIAMSKFPITTQGQIKNNRFFFKWKDKFQEKFSTDIILKTEWAFV